MEKRPWTAEDLRFMRDNVNTLDNSELSRILGRTEAAIKNAICWYDMQRDHVVVVYMRANSQSGEKSVHWKGGPTARKIRRRPSCREYTRVYRMAYPERELAHRVIRDSKRKGNIKEQPCEICGTIVNIDAHHSDYSKMLDVRWLCRSCHIHLHQRLEINQSV